MSIELHGSRLASQLTKCRVPPEVTSDAILMFLEALDCPRALTVALLFREGEHEQLANLSFDPLHYCNTMELGDAYAATQLLSKFKGLKLPYDLDERALAKFNLFENGCGVTNSLFRDLSKHPSFKGRVVWLHNAVIRKIDQILGEITNQELVGMANWGPGATTTIKSKDASATIKFQCETGITRDLYSLFSKKELASQIWYSDVDTDFFGASYPLWSLHLSETGQKPNFQVGNKVVTVPKDATKNRVIAIEPGLNLWFQSAVGKAIQHRLLRFGIDIRDQSANQELARQGSITGELATVDFSSASDSISRKVVEALLPPQWLELLDACRSHYGLLDDSPPKLWNKISSMGNGFTFPLETLIFYAVAVSCVEYFQVSLPVSVYGDDVIIPTNCLGLFAEMCAFYGFTLNQKKSHFASAFRESCGRHYVSGIEVTPIYLKDRIIDVPSIYRFANAVRRYAHRRAFLLGCDARFKRLFGYLVNIVPKALRLRIDNTLGDGGFISNWDEAVPVRAKYSLEGYWVQHVADIGQSIESIEVGLLLDRLWELERRSVSNMVFRGPAWLRTEHPILKLFRQRLIELIGRGPESSVRVKNDLGYVKSARNSVPIKDRVRASVTRSLVARWYDLGPWLDLGRRGFAD
jgi:hypothetical protein